MAPMCPESLGGYSAYITVMTHGDRRGSLPRTTACAATEGETYDAAYRTDHCTDGNPGGRDDLRDAGPRRPHPRIDRCSRHYHQHRCPPWHGDPTDRGRRSVSPA